MTRKLVLIAVLALLAFPALADKRPRTPYFASGHVSQMKPYRGGYRVWVGGSRYPFFVPSSHFRNYPFAVGALVNLGGYYNRRGYYDYYCYGCSRDGSSSGRSELRFRFATVRGVVESIDERLDTFIIRAEGNDSPVTVRRGNDRGVGELRVGDHLEVDGEWTRTGYFDAIRIDYAEARREQ